MRYRHLLIGVAAILLAVVVGAPRAQALSGSDFNPGRIIDDSIFFNKDAMSVSDIQNFIAGKTGPCDTNHPSGTPSYSPPWTCVYQYYENPTTHENNIGSPGTIPSGGISAAQIIYNAAQTYNISPKVIIVLLQKEQSLITDNWPYPSQYRGATGYGCPDGAPCDTQYYGFYNQVMNAARQFRRYATYPNEYNYAAGRNNNILYNPNSACGYQTVYIQNQATAGLYNYTPYVPNAAALNNLYGLGDSCSAYGNRNFWRLYNDWFGSTYNAPYQWQIVSQSYSLGSTDIISGNKETLTVVVKNTGTSAWLNSGSSPVRLATVDPQNRQSPLYDASWVSPSRPATLQESRVEPGQNGTFSFTIQAPAPGVYQERFSLVAENAAWLNDPGMYFYLNVASPTLASQLVSQNLPTTLDAGQSASVQVVYKNTGNTTWYKDGWYPTRLGINSGSANLFQAPGWISSSRPATFTESSVPPGSNATFAFSLLGPPQLGTYSLQLHPVLDNLAWLSPLVNVNTTVGMPKDYSGTYQWQIVSQQYSLGDVYISAGNSETLTVRARNTGTATWYSGGSYPLRLANVDPRNRQSSFYHSSWLSPSRPATLQETSVAPGGIGTFSFTVTAPSTKGVYQERMSLVSEYYSWLNDPGMYFYIEVR